jgi:CheY-like chemotaxis protein
MPNQATGIADPKPPKRLLLVDDEDAIVIPMAGYFRRLGCFVSTTGSPDEAIEAIRAEPFDLCLLDLRLKPYDRGGLDVLSFLRTARPATPVIILSANVSAEAEEEARRLGARAILRKPQPLAHVAQTALALMKVRRNDD